MGYTLDVRNIDLTIDTSYHFTCLTLAQLFMQLFYKPFTCKIYNLITEDKIILISVHADSLLQ